MKTKTDNFVLIFGFLMVAAYWPLWSQAAMEPKSIVLYLGGGLAWIGLARQAQWSVHLSPLLWAPLLYLGFSTFWSVNPFLGVQRISLFMAAIGVSLLVASRGAANSLLKGFGWGLSVHALVLVAQNFPWTLRFLPSFLGAESLYGYPGGLFFNSNMAALPLLAGVTCLFFGKSEQSGIFKWHLPFWFFALTLTQSRACLLAAFACISYWSVTRLRQKAPVLSSWEVACLGLLVLSAGFWAIDVFPWGAVLILGAIFLGMKKSLTLSKRELPVRWVLLISLLASLWIGLAVRHGTDSALQVKGQASVGESSLNKRKSYYLAAIQGWVDAPLLGQGLGSARSHYPRLVDPTLPLAKTGYGDFVRPNNLHSEPLEFLLEGGLFFLAALGLGVFLQARKTGRGNDFERILVLAPLLLVSLIDFPLHKPFGVLWLALISVTRRPGAVPLRASGRFVLGFQGGILMLMALGMGIAASLRPGVESSIHQQDSIRAWEGAQKIMKCHPFDPEYQDLYSKAMIQWGASPEGQASPRTQARLLDQALRLDPWDHHLLLRRAQLARSQGDSRGGQVFLERYGAIAPPDPDRFLRFAKDAWTKGNKTEMDALLAAAKRQPGWNQKHAQVASALTREAN